MGVNIYGTSRLVPIIGDPVYHARVPDWFSHHLAKHEINTVCVPMEVPGEALDDAMTGLNVMKNIDGIIVTMPHKTTTAPYCATVTEASRLLNVVSAMRRNVDGTWHGHTTDGDAFVKAQIDNGATVEGARVLLLGAGGAGSAIAIAMLGAGVKELVIHDPDQSRLDTLLSLLADLGGDRVKAGGNDPTGFDLICNATPLGMNAEDPLPVDVDLLEPSMFVGDVIAGHGETAIMKAAKAKGCKTADGDDMVVAVLDIMMDYMNAAWKQMGDARSDAT